MNYQKFTPVKELQPYVLCYFVWEAPDNGPQVFESPPSGCCSIVFNQAAPYFIQSKKYDRQEVPAAFITGQAVYSYKLFFESAISMAGIVLKPAALASLFNLPAFELTEERVDMTKIFLPVMVERIANELKQATDAKTKAMILEQFLLQQLQHAHPSIDYIDEAAGIIMEKHGMLHVNDLMENIFMSRRNFERRFFKKVGLSPKYYARITRMSYLCNLIAGKKKVDWASLLHQCEFYDQSHFIKDFVEFTGRTPQQYLEENRELANYIEKPKEETL